MGTSAGVRADENCVLDIRVSARKSVVVSGYTPTVGDYSCSDSSATDVPPFHTHPAHSAALYPSQPVERLNDPHTRTGQ